jgi:hypothetical protein
MCGKLWLLSLAEINTLQVDADFSLTPFVGRSAGISARVFQFGAQDFQYNHTERMNSPCAMTYK